MFHILVFMIIQDPEKYRIDIETPYTRVALLKTMYITPCSTVKLIVIIAKKGMLMSIPQCIILEILGTLNQLSAYINITEYFWKFQ